MVKNGVRYGSRLTGDAVEEIVGNTVQNTIEETMVYGVSTFTGSFLFSTIGGIGTSQLIDIDYA